MWHEWAIPLAGVLIAGISVWHQRVQNQQYARIAKSQERIAETYATEVAGLKREVTALRKQLGKRMTSDEERLALAQQREARLQRKQEQENLKMVGEAIKWASQNL